MPGKITGRIRVTELDFGDQSPSLDLIEIADMMGTPASFAGMFRLVYSEGGGARISLETTVQVNPVPHPTHNLSSPRKKKSFNPGCRFQSHPDGIVMASSPLEVPMKLELSQFHLDSIFLFRVSEKGGATLSFKYGPLKSVKINSTFDNVPSLKQMIDREVVGAMQQALEVVLPQLVHEQSLSLLEEEEAKKRRLEKKLEQEKDDLIERVVIEKQQQQKQKVASTRLGRKREPNNHHHESGNLRSSSEEEVISPFPRRSQSVGSLSLGSRKLGRRVKGDCSNCLEHNDSGILLACNYNHHNNDDNNSELETTEPDGNDENYDSVTWSSKESETGAETESEYEDIEPSSSISNPQGLLAISFTNTNSNYYLRRYSMYSFYPITSNTYNCTVSSGSCIGLSMFFNLKKSNYNSSRSFRRLRHVGKKAASKTSQNSLSSFQSTSASASSQSPFASIQRLSALSTSRFTLSPYTPSMNHILHKATTNSSSILKRSSSRSMEGPIFGSSYNNNSSSLSSSSSLASSSLNNCNSSSNSSLTMVGKCELKLKRKHKLNQLILK